MMLDASREAGSSVETGIINQQFLEKFAFDDDLLSAEVTDGVHEVNEANNYIINVNSHLSVALLELAEASAFLATDVDNCVFIVASPNDINIASPGCNPSRLGQIYWFNNLIVKTRQENPDKRLVICTGRHPSAITSCVLLIGSILILVDGVSVDIVKQTFEPFSDLFLDLGDEAQGEDTLLNKFNIFDCWHALSHALNLGWLDFSSAEVDIRNCIDMEEYCHYDSPANGNLHVIVPSKLVALSCPTTFDPESAMGRQWLDVNGVRYFSPEYYGELLSDFDVKLVVDCSAHSSSYDASALQSAGIEVEALPVSYQNQMQLLQHTDRFLTLAKCVPGALAIHGDGAALGDAELLICAYLLQHHAFATANTALAWVRILHPAAPPAIHLKFATAFPVPPAARRPPPPRRRRHTIQCIYRSVLAGAAELDGECSCRHDPAPPFHPDLNKSSAPGTAAPDWGSDSDGGEALANQPGAVDGGGGRRPGAFAAGGGAGMWRSGKALMPQLSLPDLDCPEVNDDSDKGMRG